MSYAVSFMWRCKIRQLISWIIRKRIPYSEYLFCHTGYLRSMTFELDEVLVQLQFNSSFPIFTIHIFLFFANLPIWQCQELVTGWVSHQNIVSNTISIQFNTLISFLNWHTNGVLRKMLTKSLHKVLTFLRQSGQKITWGSTDFQRRVRLWISVLHVSVGQNKNKIMDGNCNSIQQTNDTRNNPRKSSHQSRNQFRFEWFWTNTNAFRFSLCMSFSSWYNF